MLLPHLFDQEGTLYNADFEKYSLRSNTFFKKGKFTAQANLSLNMSDRIQEKSLMV